MEAIAFFLRLREAIPLMSCKKMIKIVLHQRDVSPPTIPTNIATRMAYIDRGGRGPYFVPLVGPIGQQLTNTAAAGGR